jgi:hypothetical protein
VHVVVLARCVLLVAVAVPAGGIPPERKDRRRAADDADDAPDRVRERGEQRQPGYFRSTTIVFTEAVTLSAISTTTT